MKKYRLNEKSWKQKEAWKLVNENWTLAHEVVDARDGHQCVLCASTRNLQLDHAISRTHKSVFFDTDNLNWLCSECHTAKSFNPGGIIGKQVDLVTRCRMGGPAYEDMVRRANITCPQWRTLSWQEACNLQLREELAMVLSVSDLRGWKS